jgi:SAM-dependent methyltransferase
VSRTRPAPKPAIDRFALYELCAQSPERDARMLRAIHGAQPRTLGEDFCGTAALSAAWVALHPGGRAVAVDLDRETLDRAAPRASSRLRLVQADVRSVRAKVDVIAVQNFSINELHTRRDLVDYLRHARARLSPGGCFVCDCYDGADAYVTGVIRQSVAPSPDWPRGVKIAYRWEHRTADPLSGRVVCAMHFEVRSGSSVRRFDDAFVYDWRRWSVPELRDAMLDAGFGRTEVYPRTAAAVDSDGEFYASPIEDALEVGDSFNVYVVARPAPARRTSRSPR